MNPLRHCRVSGPAREADEIRSPLHKETETATVAVQLVHRPPGGQSVGFNGSTFSKADMRTVWRQGSSGLPLGGKE
jgi:hypothetical protein